MRAQLLNRLAPNQVLDHAAPRQLIDLKTFHAEASFLRILGVNYIHLNTQDGGDLYVTEHGVPLVRHLEPQNWFETQWFAKNRQRLPGTGTVYRVPTRPVAGTSPRSIDLVVKWSRVGQDVALDTFTLQRNVNAEFNTPFEEFARLEELRRGEQSKEGIRVLTQKPLAIYVPSEQMQPWQTGRSKQKILTRTLRHPGVEIDVLRAYIMLYGWIEGHTIIDALKSCIMDLSEQRRQIEQMTQRVDRELASNGFMVADHKPSHFIVRFKKQQILRHKSGEYAYALVDYELLSRTAAYEDWVVATKRKEYLQRQRDRFLDRPEKLLPAELKAARVFSVSYIHGKAESTGGTLWVVGNDPGLFPYFLPERWRSGKQVKLSNHPQTYYTQTKDRIHMVWKVSRVGEVPEGDLADSKWKQMLKFGFNSPFEEFDLAMEMQRVGIKTVYPRAIYMTASPGDVSGYVLDDRRFERLKKLLSPTGKPVMPLNHDYITIWGYWRGLEDDQAIEDTMLWTPIGLGSAVAKGIIDQRTAREAMDRHITLLASAGYLDKNQKPEHVMISYIPSGAVKTDTDGKIETRQCNFELVAKI